MKIQDIIEASPMSPPPLHVGLIVGPNSELEANALRFSLEYFGARVTMVWVGRPADVLDVCAGRGPSRDCNHIVFSFHGLRGKLVMPRLGRSIYRPEEPRGDLPASAMAGPGFKRKLVIAAACSFGSPANARVFLESGASAFIGPKGYPEASASLLYLTSFYYHQLQNGVEPAEAHRLAAAQDRETARFQYFAR